MASDSDAENDADYYDQPANTVHLHPSHPIYLNQNDHPGLILVTQALIDGNFTQWRRSFINALTAKNKMGMVTGESMKPTANSKYAAHWVRCNDMVVVWILNVVSAEIASSVVYFSSAKEVWDDLITRFSKYDDYNMVIHGYPDLLFNEKSWIALNTRRWPFVTHFLGYKPCGSYGDYPVERCLRSMEWAFNFADNQVLKLYGFRHRDLLSLEIERFRNESVTPLESVDQFDI